MQCVCLKAEMNGPRIQAIVFNRAYLLELMHFTDA